MKNIRFSSMKSKSSFMLLVVAVCILVFTCSVFAAPANDQEIILVQPDGESFNAKIIGDEFGNWIESVDGIVLVQDPSDGFWKKARLNEKKDKVIPGAKMISGASDPSNIKVRQFLIDMRIQKKTEILAASDAALASGSAGAPAMVPSFTIKPKILVLLVEFTDISIANSDAIWSNSFFGVSGKTVNSYYKEVSKGSFWFEPASEAKGNANDGVVKVKLSYAHPRTDGDIDERNQKIVSDALSAANAYVNFAAFDLNGNNSLSTDELNIVTVVAGYERAYSATAPSVWAHSWSISSIYRFDGKRIEKYTQQGEMQGTHMATIGVLCHELGHNIGLPDLYDYGYDSDGIGVHSLMAGGSWGMGTQFAGESPTHLDAYCKALLGFATPVIVSAPGSTYSLYSDPTNYNIYRVNTSVPGEYFLFENRQFNDFDVALQKAGVKSGGVAIWHIDESVTTRNEDELHKLVDLEEADEGIVGFSELDTKSYPVFDHYFHADSMPGLANNTVFSLTNKPDSRLYNGTASGVYAKILTGYSSAMNITFAEPVVANGQEMPVLTADNTALTNGNVTVSIQDLNAASTLYCKTNALDSWVPYVEPLVIQANCTVYAKSVSNVIVAESLTSTLVVGNIDKQPPTAPSGLKYAATRNSLSITWTASTDANGIKEYWVYCNGIFKETVPVPGTTKYTITGLNASTRYSVIIRAIDMAGNYTDSVPLAAKTTR